MKADTERQEAAGVLVAALPDGSSLALSGFGERQLDLTLKRLDRNVDSDRQRRKMLDDSRKLSSGDNKTYLFEAIAQVIHKVSGLPRETLIDAPPALIILSDFREDPKAPDGFVQQVCGDLKATGLELIAVGFGNVDQGTLRTLEGCSASEHFAAMSSDPASLVDTFWKVSRRLSHYLRIREFSAGGGQPVSTPIAGWANEAVVVARSTVPTEHWTLQLNSQMAETLIGGHFRVAHIPAHAVKDLTVEIQGADAALSIALAGDAVVSLQPPFDQPRLRNEPIEIRAGLVSGKTGNPISEWPVFDDGNYAGRLHYGSEIISMDLDTAARTFRAVFPVPQAGPHQTAASLTIDDVLWTSPSAVIVNVRNSPITVDPASASLSGWAWLPGARSRLALASSLGNRSFELEYAPSTRLGTAKGRLMFDAATHERGIFVTADAARTPSVRDWFTPLEPISGVLTMNVTFPAGTTVGPFEAAVVISFVPLWLRLLIAFAPLLPILAAVRGRRLPPWRLVPVDLNGKQRPGDGVRLRNYRKSLDLSAFGIQGAKILRGLGGTTFVRPGPRAEVFPAGNRELAVRTTRRVLRVGDVIFDRGQDGKDFGFKVDKW